MNKESIKEREKEKQQVGNEVIGASPAGLIEQVPNLKKRQRSVYYRPITVNGSVDWQPTQLLPSDAVGRELYLSKGFRLSPPKPTDTVIPEQITDTEKENLLAENTKLRQQLSMANARSSKKS